MENNDTDIETNDCISFICAIRWMIFFNVLSLLLLSVLFSHDMHHNVVVVVVFQSAMGHIKTGHLLLTRMQQPKEEYRK